MSTLTLFTDDLDTPQPKKTAKTTSHYAFMSEILGPKPTKSYKSDAFLSSRLARSIRVQCELGDAEARLKQRGIDGTVLFFGSARSRTR